MSDGVLHSTLDISQIPWPIVALVRGAGLTRGVLLEHLGVPGPVEDDLLISVLGISRELLKALRADFRAQLERTADELLADSNFADTVARLPFARGQRVVVVGDSLSADALSWANILAVVLERRGIELINRAVSGRTSAETIGVFSHVAALDPDWIIFAIGANDLRRHGTVAAVRVASTAESVRNLGELVRMARVECQADVILMPSYPAIDPGMVEANRAAGTFWLIDDVIDARRAIAAEYPDAIEFGSAVVVDPGFWGPDGIHPSAEGHVSLALEIITALADRS
jgi:lysophospholipase L1-like esterase